MILIDLLHNSFVFIRVNINAFKLRVMDKSGILRFKKKFPKPYCNIAALDLPPQHSSAVSTHYL